jgi:hypothetical protein
MHTAIGEGELICVLVADRDFGTDLIERGHSFHLEGQVELYCAPEC